MENRWLAHQILKTDWLKAALVFIPLVLFHCWQDIANHYTHVFVDAYYHLTYIQAHQHPEWFKLDWLLGNPETPAKTWFAYPLYMSLLSLGMQTVGFFQTLSLLQGLFGFLYLFGAFFLLAKLTGKTWPSIFLAALTAFHAEVFPGEVRGVLSVGLVMPGTFLLALSPWLLFGWLSTQAKPRLKPLFFFLLGLVGTFHPLSWLMLTFSMLFAEVLQARFTLKSLREAALCGLMSAIPLIPFALSWSSLHAHQTLSPEAITAGIQVLEQNFLPVRFIFLFLGWKLLLLSMGWTLCSLWALWKSWRQIPPLILYFGIGAFVLFFGSYALNEWVLLPRHTAFLDGYRTVKYTFLPAMIALALWLSRFTGIAALLRGSLVLAMVLFVNFSVLWQDLETDPLNLPQILLKQWAYFVVPEDPRIQVRQDEVMAMAQWIRNTLPAETTLLHISTPNMLEPAKLRALSQRSITITTLDGGPLYLYNPSKLLHWWKLEQQLQAIRKSNWFCADAEVRIANEIGATHLICPAEASRSDLKALFQNKALVLYQLPSLKKQDLPPH